MQPENRSIPSEPCRSTLKFINDRIEDFAMEVTYDPLETPGRSSSTSP